MWVHAEDEQTQMLDALAAQVGALIQVDVTDNNETSESDGGFGYPQGEAWLN